MLAIGQADCGGDFGAGEVLKDFEMLFGFGRVGRRVAARAPWQIQTEACKGWIGKSLFKHINFFVEFFQLAIADTLEVVRVRIARIEFGAC